MNTRLQNRKQEMSYHKFLSLNILDWYYQIMEK